VTPIRRPLLIGALVSAVVVLVASVAVAVGSLGSPSAVPAPGPSMMHTQDAGACKMMKQTQAPGAGMTHTQAPGACMMQQTQTQTQAPGTGMTHTG
jgi:hypothetical protein